MEYGFDFKEKSVLITGAAGGIGFECAKAFLKNGAFVYITDYNEKALSERVKELAEEYPQSRFKALLCDVSDSSCVRRTVEEIKAEGGKVDVLVNNAGIAHTAYSIYEKEEDWNKVITLNLTSQFFLSQVVANEFMIEQKGGKIINMSSLGGIMGIPGATAYSASKGAVIQMTKSLAYEWSRFGINVNCVCPGYVDTPLIKENMSNEKWCEYMLMRTPLRRFAKPEDVAGAVLFLASPMADYITGSSVVIDGGMSAGA